MAEDFSPSSIPYIVQDKEEQSRVVGDYCVVRTLSNLPGPRKVLQGVRRRTGEQVAIKVLPKDSCRSPQSAGGYLRSKMVKGSGNGWRKESKLMAELGDLPNIVRLVEVVDTPRSIDLVMQYAQGGDLATYIHNQHGLKPSEAWRIFKQLIGALNSIHKRNIIHRDVKPENIFLDECNNVLLGDFGLSCKWAKGKYKSRCCGSFGFMSPNLLVDEPVYEGPELDAWSAGVCLYMMMFNESPFKADSSFEELWNARTCTWRRKDISDPVLLDLLNRIFDEDPQKRATIEDILNHEWMQTQPIDNLSRRPTVNNVRRKKLSARRKGSKGLATIYEEPIKEEGEGLVSVTSPTTC